MTTDEINHYIMVDALSANPTYGVKDLVSIINAQGKEVDELRADVERGYDEGKSFTREQSVAIAVFASKQVLAQNAKTKIALVIIDSGDGSSGIQYMTPEAAHYVVNEDSLLESYSCNDDMFQTITVPKGLTPAHIGISQIYTLEDVKNDDF